ncbi:MAG: hypothetical protein AAF403_05415 [Pseudomonadota bacterium]
MSGGYCVGVDFVSGVAATLLFTLPLLFTLLLFTSFGDCFFFCTLGLLLTLSAIALVHRR